MILESNLNSFLYINKMSISYSGIVGYGKSTLPSVESWGTNMNILRDPPKSIMTRRINKVGETSSLNQMIEESGDRACEGISLYARGVNPSVSVDYGNAGNNGGQRSGFGGTVGVSRNMGSSGNSICGGQAYLPYTVNKDGAFRPPIQTPFDLLPLSRQRRGNTKVSSNKGFIDYSKKLMCPGGKLRAINEKTLKVSVRPTKTYKMNTQIVEPFEVKYVIKNPVKFDLRAGDTGMRTQDLTTQDVLEPTKEINNTPMYLQDVYTNKTGKNLKYSDNSHMNTDRYLQDPLNSSVESKMSRSIQITPIEDIFDVDIHTKDAMNISYTPLKTGYTNEERIHKDVELQRRVLATTVATNKHRDIYSRPQHEHQAIQNRNRPIAQATTNYGTIGLQSTTDLNSRDYRLNDTLPVGGISGRGQLPHKQVNSDIQLSESIQHSRNRRVMEMQLNRN
jgi:hypothetical protein